MVAKINSGVTVVTTTFRQFFTRQAQKFEDMERQFAEAKGYFLQIQKTRSRHGLGNICIKFQVYIVLRLFWTCNTNTDIHI